MRGGSAKAYVLKPGEKVLIPQEEIGPNAQRPVTYIEDKRGCFIVASHKAKVGMGYPRIRVEGKQYTMHRFVYIHFHGPIPDDLVVCHSCDNPECCNPAHLWLGTSKDNAQDMIAKGRGHKFSQESLELLRERTRGNTLAKGERNSHAKLTTEQVRMIREERPYKTLKQLAAEYGVHNSTIQKIVYGEHWNA